MLPGNHVYIKRSFLDFKRRDVQTLCIKTTSHRRLVETETRAHTHTQINKQRQNIFLSVVCKKKVWYVNTSADVLSACVFLVYFVGSANLNDLWLKEMVVCRKWTVDSATTACCFLVFLRIYRLGPVLDIGCDLPVINTVSGLENVTVVDYT